MFIYKMVAETKRKRCEGIEETKDAFPMLAKAKDVDNPNEPMAFTCICFEGKFYTTDDMGNFIHKDPNHRMHKLYRCEMKRDSSEIQFIFIRSLSDIELMHFENVNDVNVIRDLSK